MAKSREHVSWSPEDAERGGTIGFPDGAEVELTEAKATTWEEAGEGAIKGGRQPDDPALMLVGEVEDRDDPVTVFLGAGKANRMQPDSDGEFFEPADGSSAKGLSDNCNAMVFLQSLCDKKVQGRMTLDSGILNGGISKLVGLKFRAGYKLIKREGLDADPERKPRPTLISVENIALPKAGSGKAQTKSRRDEDKDGAEEEAAAKSRGKSGGKGKAASNGLEPDAEKYILQALNSARWKKGLPLGKVYSALFNEARDEEEREDIAKFGEDEDWVKNDARPWVYDKDEDKLGLA